VYNNINHYQLHFSTKHPENLRHVYIQCTDSDKDLTGLTAAYSANVQVTVSRCNEDTIYSKYL
jgi:hypothetical protein